MLEFDCSFAQASCSIEGAPVPVGPSISSTNRVVVSWACLSAHFPCKNYKYIPPGANIILCCVIDNPVWSGGLTHKCWKTQLTTGGFNTHLLRS